MQTVPFTLRLVCLQIARFVGYERKPPDVIEQACERLDDQWELIQSQRMLISKLSIENSKKLVEIEHLEDELDWLTAVLKAAGVKLARYDHLRKKKF